jgi:hypothetical protein
VNARANVNAELLEEFTIAALAGPSNAAKKPSPGSIDLTTIVRASNDLMTWGLTGVHVPWIPVRRVGKD